MIQTLNPYTVYYVEPSNIPGISPSVYTAGVLGRWYAFGVGSRTQPRPLLDDYLAGSPPTLFYNGKLQSALSSGAVPLMQSDTPGIDINSAQEQGGLPDQIHRHPDVSPRGWHFGSHWLLDMDCNHVCNQLGRGFDRQLYAHDPRRLCRKHILPTLERFCWLSRGHLRPVCGDTIRLLPAGQGYIGMYLPRQRRFSIASALAVVGWIAILLASPKPIDRLRLDICLFATEFLLPLYLLLRRGRSATRTELMVAQAAMVYLIWGSVFLFHPGSPVMYFTLTFETLTWVPLAVVFHPGNPVVYPYVWYHARCWNWGLVAFFYFAFGIVQLIGQYRLVSVLRRAKRSASPLYSSVGPFKAPAWCCTGLGTIPCVFLTEPGIVPLLWYRLSWVRDRSARVLELRF